MTKHQNRTIPHLPITMPSSLPKQFVGTDLADQILNDLTVSSGGTCPKCKGSGFANSGVANERGVIQQTRCPTCNGTGQVTKTLGQLVEEATKDGN